MAASIGPARHQEIAMLPATIKTAVAAEIVTEIARLFNRSARDILNKLLQSTRRANAGSVRVTLTGQAGRRLQTVTDDGHDMATPTTKHGDHG